MMRNALRLCAIAVLCTAVSACLPDGDLGDRTERVETVRQAQAAGMARALSVVAAQGFGQFMNNNASPFWQARQPGGGGIAAVQTRTIDFQAMFGMNMGPASQMVSAGYCADPAAGANRSMVVWLNQRDANGRFTPLGLGTGGTGAVMAELMKMNNPASVGLANNAATLAMNDGAQMTLGNCAGTFNIPVGAPVMVFADLQEAANMQTATTRVETQTIACGGGKTGTITQRRTITVQTDGTEDNPVWNTVSELCFDSADTIAAKNVSDSTSNLLSNLTNNLRSAQLQEALSTLNNQTCKSMIIQRKTIDERTGEQVTENYDTCSGATTTSAVSDLERYQNGTPYYETKTGACTASTVGDSDSRMISIANIPVQLQATISRNRWGPDNGASYRRKVTPYRVREPDGTYSDVKLRDSWEGVALNCSRVETATMNVEDYAPNWPDIGANPANLILISGEIVYQRNAYVNGWADVRALSPNQATYSSWANIRMDGVWQEREVSEIECPDPLKTKATQTKVRTHTLVSYKNVNTSGWTITDTCPGAPKCTEQTLNDYRSCPAGYEGTRLYSRTINQGDVCNADTGWSLVSDNCHEVPVGRCSATTQTISQSCPLGQSGEKIFTRTIYTGGTNCEAPTEWKQISDTCHTPPCAEVTEDEYRECGTGFQGQKHFTRVRNQGDVCGQDTDWAEKTEDSTCEPICEPEKIDGVCNPTTTSTPQSTAPDSAALCSKGTPSWSGGDQTGSDGTFNWTCVGSTTPRGDDVQCSASKPQTCAPAYEYGDTCEGGSVIRSGSHYEENGMGYPVYGPEFSAEQCYAAGGNCYEMNQVDVYDGANATGRHTVGLYMQCYQGATGVSPEGSRDVYSSGNEAHTEAWSSTMKGSGSTCTPGEHEIWRRPVAGAQADRQYDQTDANRVIGECNAAGGTRNEIQPVESSCHYVGGQTQETWCDFELICYGN